MITVPGLLLLPGVLVYCCTFRCPLASVSLTAAPLAARIPSPEEEMLTVACTKPIPSPTDELLFMLQKKIQKLFSLPRYRRSPHICLQAFWQIMFRVHLLSLVGLCGPETALRITNPRMIFLLLRRKQVALHRLLRP